MSAEHGQDSSVRERTINSEELDGKSRTFSIKEIEQKIGRDLVPGDILYADNCRFPTNIYDHTIGPGAFKNYGATYYVEVIGSETRREEYYSPQGVFGKKVCHTRSVRVITMRRLTDWGPDDTNRFSFTEGKPHLWTGIVKREDQPRYSQKSE